MDLMPVSKRYASAFIDGSPPVTWALYIGVGICFAWLAVLTVAIVSVMPDVTTNEINDIAQAMELIGWFGLFYMTAPLLFGLFGVLGQLWRDVR